MESDTELYALQVISFSSSKSEIKYYSKDNTINDYIRELSVYFSTTPKNLCKYVEFTFNGKPNKNYYYEVTFHELEQKNIRVIAHLNDAFFNNEKKIFSIKKMNFICLNLNLIHYIINFLPYQEINTIFRLNKKFFKLINLRRKR